VDKKTIQEHKDTRKQRDIDKEGPLDRKGYIKQKVKAALIDALEEIEFLIKVK